jgi:integrase
VIVGDDGEALDNHPTTRTHPPVRQVVGRRRRALPGEYSGRFDFYSPKEVWAIVRKAADEQDGAIFLTAAFTGLRRGEVLALRVRDCDFAREVVRVEHSLDGQELGTPKSGRTRSVPMHPTLRWCSAASLP